MGQQWTSPRLLAFCLGLNSILDWIPYPTKSAISVLHRNPIKNFWGAGWLFCFLSSKISKQFVFEHIHSPAHLVASEASGVCPHVCRTHWYPLTRPSRSFPANHLAPGPGTFVVLAPPCGSWGRVCRGTSMRSQINPLGCCFEFVADANITISRPAYIGIRLGIRLGLSPPPHRKYVGLLEQELVSLLGLFWKCSQLYSSRCCMVKTKNQGFPCDLLESAGST